MKNQNIITWFRTIVLMLLTKKQQHNIQYIHKSLVTHVVQTYNIQDITTVLTQLKEIFLGIFVATSLRRRDIRRYHLIHFHRLWSKLDYLSTETFPQCCSLSMWSNHNQFAITGERISLQCSAILHQ